MTGPHWTISGGESITTSSPITGARSLRVNPTASAQSAVTSISLGVGLHVFRFRAKWTTLPDANCAIGTTGSGVGAYFNVADSKIYAGSGLGNIGATGISVTTGVLYYIDVKVDTTANPWVVDAKVNGSACGQHTRALAANTSANTLLLGAENGNNTSDALFDDVLWSLTGADYPLGDGFVNHFIPTSDGTHNVAGADDFERGNTGTDITNATTTAFQLVDDVPMKSSASATDNIQATAPPNASDYVEVVFGPASGISTPTVAPRSVEVIVAHSQAATQSGNIRLALNDNGSLDDVLNLTAAGVTTIRYARKHYSDPPSAASAWTLSGNGNFNNARMRFFSSDAAPDQNWQCAMIEAEFAPIVLGLSAGTATFALSGQNANLLRARKATADAGSFSFTGNAATLTRGRSVVAGSGSFAESGNAVNLQATRKLSAGVGSFVESGQSVSLRSGKRIALVQGSFAESGNAVNLLATRKLSAGVGSFVESGQSVSLKSGKIIVLNQGSFGETGNPTNLLIGRKLSAASGAFNETGNPVSLLFARRDSVLSGSFSFNGIAVSLRADRKLMVDVGSFVETGISVGLVYQPVGHFVISIGSGSLALTGSATNLLRSHIINASPGVFSETGQTVPLLWSRRLTANAGGFVETGFSQAPLHSRVLPIPFGSFSELGIAAALLRGLKIQPEPGVFVLSEEDVLLKLDRLIALAFASFLVDGHDAELSQDAANKSIVLGSGSFVLVGSSVVLRLKSFRALPEDITAIRRTDNVLRVMRSSATLRVAPD